MMQTTAHGGPKSELREALGSCLSAFIGIGAFSGLINLLMLTGSLFMLEVYDRVLPSRSVPTLVGLSVLTAVLVMFQAWLEITRGRRSATSTRSAHFCRALVRPRCSTSPGFRSMSPSASPFTC